MQHRLFSPLMQPRAASLVHLRLASTTSCSHCLSTALQTRPACGSIWTSEALHVMRPWCQPALSCLLNSRIVDMAPSPQVTLEVRGLVQAGDVAGAVNCVLAATRAEPRPDLKLRTFAPAFGAVCDKDDAATAWQLQVWAAHACEGASPRCVRRSGA